VKLDFALLANHAEIQNNLAFVSGGGIDTINTPRVPAPFVGAILLRFLMHPAEADRLHDIEVKFLSEDGSLIAGLKGQVGTEANPEDPMPKGWHYPVMMAFNLTGLKLKTVGHYSVEIFADNAHVGSLPFRVRIVPPSTVPGKAK
jgi:hypothetical protein